jgi:hypothetical protein
MKAVMKNMQIMMELRGGRALDVEMTCQSERVKLQISSGISFFFSFSHNVVK